jgi:hypothetical protein
MGGPGLFDLEEAVHAEFKRLVAELAAHGARVAPGLELRRGEGMLCTCDLKDGHIYVALPQRGDPTAKLKVLFLRSLLGCSSEAELVRMLHLLMPWLLAHELGHHCRWHLGLFGKDLWLEEQIANRFASAMAKHRMPLRDWEDARGLLGRAFHGLAQQAGLPEQVAASFDDVLHAMGRTGAMAESSLRQAGRVAVLFGVDPTELLRGREVGLDQRIAARRDVIDDFNAAYTSDVARYMAYQVGWILIDLDSPRHLYLDGLVRNHLATRPVLLECPPERGPAPRPDEVRALHAASRRAGTGPLKRWFYKRYRRSLLLLLEGNDARMARQSVTVHLEDWSGEADADTLPFIAGLVEPWLRGLFPAALAETQPRDDEIAAGLVQDADRRLWAFGRGALDDAAAESVRRMVLLEGAPLFRALPAEFLLGLAHALQQVEVEPGEAVIHQGRTNDDVFLVASGSLDVEKDGGCLAQILPGDVFGEMAFFTQRPRTATVRARERSACVVLPATELRLFAHRHPSVLAQMAHVLAVRLENARP